MFAAPPSHVPFLLRPAAVDTDVVKSQIGFLQFVCIPYYKALADLVQPRMEPYRNCQENFWQWHKRRQLQENARQQARLEQNSREMDTVVAQCNARQYKLIRRGSGTIQALVDEPVSARLGSASQLAQQKDGDGARRDFRRGGGRLGRGAGRRGGQRLRHLIGT